MERALWKTKMTSMNANADNHINRLLQQLTNEDDNVRIEAIDEPGEVGDELCLKELREKLKYLSKEHQALKCQKTKSNILFINPANKIAPRVSMIHIINAFFQPYSFQRTDMVATQGT